MASGGVAWVGVWVDGHEDSGTEEAVYDPCAGGVAGRGEETKGGWWTWNSRRSIRLLCWVTKGRRKGADGFETRESLEPKKGYTSRKFAFFVAFYYFHLAVLAEK